MLQCHDSDIAARDPQLRGLEILLEPRRLAERLTDADPAIALDQLAIRYIRYKPRRRCLVAYRGVAGDSTVDFYATALTRSEWTKRVDQHLRYVGGYPFRFPAALPDAHLFIYPFPCDARLPAIERLWNPSTRTALLRRALGPVAPAGESHIDPLVHKPQRRFVARVFRDEFAAAVKCYTTEAYARARRKAQALQSGDVLRLVEALGRSRRHRMMILPWLSGNLLRESLWRKEASNADLELTGAALAELHGQNVGKQRLKWMPHKDEVQRLKRAGRDVAFLLPELNDRIQRLTDWAAAQLWNLPQLARPIHGDFYSKQILIDGGRVGVLDLDEAALGDPAADIANFLAHLETYVLRGHLDPQSAERYGQALQEGYDNVAGDQYKSRLPARVVAALLRLLHAPFRNGEPNWAQRIEDTLSQAERLAGNAPHGKPALTEPAPAKRPWPRSSVTVIDPFNISADPAFSFLAGALDGETCGRAIASCLRRSGAAAASLAPFRATVRRYKPGRRCLIEFGLRVSDGGLDDFALLGKVRVKGLDRTTYRLHRSLWQVGFSAGEDVSVPKAIECIPNWRMWLQRCVPGRPLDAPQLAAGGHELGWRIVDAIHKLHQAQVASSKRHTIRDELNILQTRLAELARQRPELTDRLRRILAACERLAGELVDAPHCGIHRDFYQDHVLARGDRLTLVDLDLYCIGDPALDIGNFLAHLIELSLRSSGTAELFLPLQAAMCERFRSHRGDRGVRRAHAYATLSLVRLIHISHQMQRRESVRKPLLDLCERRLKIWGSD